MKDDNQKTFADLFSSSDKQTSDSVTFGSLFGNVDKKEEDSISLNDKANAISENDNVISDSIFDKVSDSDTDYLKEEDNVSLDENKINTDTDNILNNDLGSNDDSLDNKVDSVSLDDSLVVPDDIFKGDSDVNGESLNNALQEEVMSDSTVDSASSDKISEDEVVVDESLNNVFFGGESSADSGDSTVDNDLNDSKVSVNDTDVVNDVSESPFFQSEDGNNESIAGDNPLLLGTLNLVENENEEKMVKSIDVSNSKHFDVKIVKKKEPLFKVILGVLSYAIFIWLLLVGVVLLIYVLDIKIRASKGDYSAPTYNAYVVLTGSMLPKIQVYDVVVTKKVKAAELKVGDVITFASADTRFLNTIITHRIIKKNYDPDTKTYSFQTRGDNNNVADSALVPQSNIYGRVFLKIPKLGYLQEFLAKDGGWIIVILVPCLAVLSYDIVKLIKGLKRKKYKNIKVQK